MRINQVSVFVGNETRRLVDMLKPLAKAGINLEYFYAFVPSEAGKATVVLKRGWQLAQRR